MGNAFDVGTRRAREDDIEDLEEPLAQREREQAESDEQSAKGTRLNSEHSKPLNALRNCSGRKKNDKICSTCDVVELFSSHQVTARARQRGFRGCWSFSKTVVDPITGRVSREEALSDPTGTVVGVRWVDHNKGTSVSPEVRSRLVAQEFAAKDRRDDLFAATPPLAATRLLLVWRVVAKGWSDPKQRSCLSM